MTHYTGCLGHRIYQTRWRKHLVYGISSCRKRWQHCQTIQWTAQSRTQSNRKTKEHVYIRCKSRSVYL